jgi:hypothetical protein
MEDTVDEEGVVEAVKEHALVRKHPFEKRNKEQLESGSTQAKLDSKLIKAERLNRLRSLKTHNSTWHDMTIRIAHMKRWKKSPNGPYNELLPREEWRCIVDYYMPEVGWQGPISDVEFIELF